MQTDKPRREAAGMRIFDPGGLRNRGPSRKDGDRKHPADSSLPLVEVWCTSSNDGPKPVSLGGTGDTRVHVVILLANSDPAGANHSEVMEPLRSLLCAAQPRSIATVAVHPSPCRRPARSCADTPTHSAWSPLARLHFVPQASSLSYSAHQV